MRSILFRLAFIVLLAIVCLSGISCTGSDNINEYYKIKGEGPTAYGANGFVAPNTFKIAPRAPRTMGYPAFEIANMPVGKSPELPPIDRVLPESTIALRQPLVGGLNPDLASNRPYTVEGINPNLPVPVEQKVYGGVYGEKGQDAPYRYQPGDVLRISVKEQPELSGVATVENDGKLQIPGTEDYIDAAGRDETQIVAMVARSVRPYVRKAPVVRIICEQASGGYYYIFGGVKNQGRFPMGAKPITLSEAVFRADSSLLDKAKGLHALANDTLRQDFSTVEGGWLGEVVLVTPHRTYPQVTLHNVALSLLGGKLEDNPVLKAGQVVIVRDRNNAQLEEYIKQITLAMQQKKPLPQIIPQAPAAMSAAAMQPVVLTPVRQSQAIVVGEGAQIPVTVQKRTTYVTPLGQSYIKKF